MHKCVCVNEQDLLLHLASIAAACMCDGKRKFVLTVVVFLFHCSHYSLVCNSMFDVSLYYNLNNLVFS